ncbi:MAG: hypothetical protein R8M38_06565 [Mariprofundaceae bacterium]
MSTSQGSESTQPRYVIGELLVAFKAEVSEQDAKKQLVAKGAKIRYYIKGQNLFHIQLPTGITVEAAMPDYQKLPSVNYVEPNYLRRIYR